MLIKRADCCLLVIDVQARLLPAVYDPALVTERCRALLQAAHAVGIPILVSEHNPQGIGPTAAAVADLVPADSVMEKIYFSCFAEPSARQRIRAADKHCFVLAGMEAHVCLGQTAIDLAAAGYRVLVAADATASRTRLDHETALHRMAQEGIDVVPAESILGAWLHGTGAEGGSQRGGVPGRLPGGLQ
jgi:nicotinamidase-related amidase